MRAMAEATSLMKSSELERRWTRDSAWRVEQSASGAAERGHRPITSEQWLVVEERIR